MLTSHRLKPSLNRPDAAVDRSCALTGVKPPSRDHTILFLCLGDLSSAPGAFSAHKQESPKGTGVSRDHV